VHIAFFWPSDLVVEVQERLGRLRRTVQHEQDTEIGDASISLLHAFASATCVFRVGQRLVFFDSPYFH